MDQSIQTSGSHQRTTEKYLTPVIFQNERVTAIWRYPLRKNLVRHIPEPRQRFPPLTFVLMVRNFSAKIKFEAVAQGSEIARAKRKRG